MTTNETSAAIPANGILAVLYSLMRSYRGRGALRQLAMINDRSLADVGLTHDDLMAGAALPMWDDPAEFLEEHRSAQSDMRPRRSSREQVIDIDPDALARAERMVMSIQSRSTH